MIKAKMAIFQYISTRSMSHNAQFNSIVILFNLIIIPDTIQWTHGNSDYGGYFGDYGSRWRSGAEIEWLDWIFSLSDVILLSKEGGEGWLAVSVFCGESSLGGILQPALEVCEFLGPHDSHPSYAGWFTGYSTTCIGSSTMRQLPLTVHAARLSLGASTIVSHFQLKNWRGND